MEIKENSTGMRFKTILKMLVNPGEVIKNQVLKVPWPFSISISGIAFTLFFLQTGLDLFRVGQVKMFGVILIAIAGFIYGTIGVMGIALLAWILSGASKRGLSIGWAISAFALGYSSTLVYAISGIAFSLLFGWKTAVAFGITGVLWALRPILFTIRQMSGEKVIFSIVLTTICGIVILFGWALLGKFGI